MTWLVPSILILLLRSSASNAGYLSDKAAREASDLNQTVARVTDAAHPACDLTQSDPPYCRDLFASICSADATDDRLQARIENEISDFLQDKFKEFYFSKRNIPFAAYGLIGALPKTRTWRENYFDYVQGLQSRLLADPKDLRDFIESLKGDLFLAIMREPTLTEIQKVRMGDRVFAIKLRLPAQAVLSDGIDEFQRVCGFDGLQANAYYDKFGPNQIVICPGLLAVADMASKGSEKADWTAVADVIGHELGHSVDGVTLSPSTGRWQLDPAFVKFYSCARQRLLKAGDRLSAFAEVSADRWGALVTGEEYYQQIISHNPQDNYKELKRDLQGLCFSARFEGDVHLSGKVRIERIIGANEFLRRGIGCYSNVAACGL